MRIKQYAFAGLMVSVMALGFSVDAQAAQITKILRGFASFDSTDIVQSVDLKDSSGNAATVTMSKSIILVFPNSATATRDQNIFYTTEFEDSGAITINRGAANSYGSVAYEVIEFEDG